MTSRRIIGGGDGRQEFSAACQSGFLHRARVRGLAQGVKVVRIEELRHPSELPVVVDTHRCGVCRKDNRGVQVLSLPQHLFRHVVHAGIELSPDTPLRYVGPRIVVGAHDAHLSPHPGGVPVSSLGGSTARRPDGGEQDEVSRHYFASAKITP